MTNIYYKQTQKRKKTVVIKIFGGICIVTGCLISLYIFLPLIMYQLFLAPVFAQNTLAAPIPRTQLISSATIQTLFNSQSQTLKGIDYTNAANWFPSFRGTSGQPRIPSYTIDIPKLTIENAVVSTMDEDLAKHLVNFRGTCVPPEKGNCVIFGHSTLPQLYNPRDYKTIFANALRLQVGDTISVHAENITYTYKIFSISVVDADDTSVLAQTLDDSYLTLITCTPPGTIWKRLIIKARLQKL